MENASFIALSRQVAIRRQMEVLANNLANMNTTAFKGERVMFEEYLMRTGPTERASFVQDYGVVRNIKAGEVKPTGNPLDLAIDGSGFLVVETPFGKRYTRSGHLRLDAEGRLTASSGYPVLDDRGRTIRLDQRDGAPSIASDGTISAGGQTLGRLDLVRFANEQHLRKTADGLYATEDAPLPADNAKVLQGMLEASNVEPILEMTNLIDLTRSYQSTQRMLESEHDRQRRVIERLAKIS